MGYKIIENKAFVNPYNFVKEDLKSKPTQDINDLQGASVYTGWIDYSITAKTPLVIPDIETEKTEIIETIKNGKHEKDEHKSYAFMRTPNGQLMIPGSSIRGVVRNVFEVITHSCFPTVKNDTFITARRTQAGKPGLLIRNAEGKWELFAADRYMLKAMTRKQYEKIRTNNKNGSNKDVWDESVCPFYPIENSKLIFDNKEMESGSAVHFEPLLDEFGKEYIYRSKSGYKCAPVVKKLKRDGGKEGILYIGEPIRNKHHESIFVKKTKVNDIPEDGISLAIKGLERTVDIYRDNAINKKYKKEHGGYVAYERMKKAGVLPIYYIDEGNRLYFQLSALGRTAFNSDMKKLVMERKPCKDRKALCKACVLFGMVQDEALGSRVRFSDALCTEEHPKTERRTLPELAGPKESYLPFYSTMKRNHRVSDISYDTNGVNIAGRKFYWHHAPQEFVLDASKTARNSTVEMALEGTVFSGRVYFDSITEEELKNIIWAMTFGQRSGEEKYCHKIGHGKPLGLGSGFIKILGIYTRHFEGTNYSIDNETFSVDCAADLYSNTQDLAIDQLRQISDFGIMAGKDVRYPYIDRELSDHARNKDNDYAAHRWFTQNKNEREKIQLLRPIGEDQEMKPYAFVNDRRNQTSPKKRKHR